MAMATVTTTCATLDRVPRPVAPVPTRETVVTIPLHRSTLDLHIAIPVGPEPCRALVLFASGDGGWFGTAVGMFRALAAEGYCAVGFSARAFLRVERTPHEPLNPEQLGDDYRVILAVPRARLSLPAETPVVLSGWSRGGALAVLAAAANSRPPTTAGVLALGLAEGEDLKIDGPNDESDDGRTVGHTAWPFLPYALLRQGVTVPGVVIQATGDDYLPAPLARVAFGPDQPRRRFIEVAGRNHRFAGGEAAMVGAMGDALRWMLATASRGAPMAASARQRLPFDEDRR